MKTIFRMMSFWIADTLKLVSG